jgi:N-acetylglutamate synthase-like GNAT family acetyltransferase
MKIRKISPAELDYVARLCVDPWMPPAWRKAMAPAMAVRKKWLTAMMHKGLKVLVAIEKTEALSPRSMKSRKVRELVVNDEIPQGLVEYAPIEYAPEPVKGKNSLFINCIWVLPKFWHQGIAARLLKEFIADARAYGGASVLAYEGDKWFGFFPYMPVSFFQKYGFREVDRDQTRVLLHLDFGAGEPPALIRPKAKAAAKSGRLVLDAFYNSQCPWSRWLVDKIKRHTKKYGAIVNEINTDDRRIIEEHGISRGVNVNGRPAIKRMASWKEVDAIVKQERQH